MLDKMFPIKIMMDNDDGAGTGDAGTGGDAGAGGDDWTATLPEGVREWDEVKNADSPDKFWDQVTNMRSFLGQSIRIPGENASKEDHQAFNEKLMSKVPGLINRPKDGEDASAFYNALGRPEKEDGYTIPTIDAKEFGDLDMTPAKEFMSVAHKHGLTQTQFEGIVADMTANNIEMAKAEEVRAQENMTLLKNEWGAAYDQNLTRIGNLVKNTGAPMALLDSINAGRVDPGTGKWLLMLADSFKGEGSDLINDKSQEFKLTPKQARQEITEIMNNKEHPYWNQSMQGHEDAKLHMRKLYKMVDSSGATAGSQTVAAGGEVRFG